VSCQGTVKATPGSVNVPVTIGGVQIAPGDAIVADDDGAVCVARAEADWALAQSGERTANEADKRARLAAGELGLDMYNLRAKLQELGVTYQ